jgi:hypothetical protein
MCIRDIYWTVLEGKSFSEIVTRNGGKMLSQGQAR